MQELEVFKTVAIVGTFVCGLCGLLVYPVKYYTTRKGKANGDQLFNYFISYGNAFGAGVILGVGLLHMLSDAAETLGEYYTYPWAFFMALVGYSFLYFIEDVVLSKMLKRFKTLILVSDMGGLVHKHGPGQNHHSRHNMHESNFKSNSVVPENANTKEMGKFKESPMLAQKESKPNNDNCTNLDEESIQSEKYNAYHANLLAFAFLFALSIHSFFAGLSMGVSDSVDSIVATLIAVIAHKAIAAFVLGQSFIRSSLDTCICVLFLVLFACTTPLGVGVGWIIVSLSDNVDKLSGFINGVSAGFFIYIGSLIVKDAPDRENANTKYKAGVFIKYLLWNLGMGLMAVAAIW
eukprot:Pgem_evm1s20295